MFCHQGKGTTTLCQALGKVLHCLVQNSALPSAIFCQRKENILANLRNIHTY